MKPLQLAKFTQSIKVKEESHYFRDQDFKIELDETRKIIRIECRRSGNVAFATLYHCVYFWEKPETEPKADAQPKAKKG